MGIYRKLLPRTKKRGVFYLSLENRSLNRLASYDEYPPVAFDLSEQLQPVIGQSPHSINQSGCILTNNAKTGENDRLQLAAVVISMANAMLATLFISIAYAMLATLAKEDKSLLIACFYRYPRI